MLCRGFYGIDTTYFKDFAGIQTEHIYNGTGAEE
ncbi:hypothetical protein [Sporisorium scitamineum]|uniref:Uncharacterized protein n=1 Tax=Sporisorium scitamineum TaxID=49012 RepID=A0A0F7S2K5_9BASI|nr:hypothetical protein [Sporisorium scitamineum]